MLQREIYKYYTFWICICSLMHPASKAHAPYCHLWLVQLHNIFPHYLTKGTISEKEKLMRVLIFFTILSETFFLLRITELGMIIYEYWSPCKVPVTVIRFYWNMNYLYRFSKNTHISNSTTIRPVNAKLLHADGHRQTDRHDEANSRFSQFCERAYKCLRRERRGNTWFETKRHKLHGVEKKTAVCDSYSYPNINTVIRRRRRTCRVCRKDGKVGNAWIVQTKQLKARAQLEDVSLNGLIVPKYGVRSDLCPADIMQCSLVTGFCVAAIKLRIR
jgi:hypothetical protein